MHPWVVECAHWSIPFIWRDRPQGSRILQDSHYTYLHAVLFICTQEFFANIYSIMMPLYHKGTNPHTASFFSGKATTASTNPQDVDAMSPSRASLYYLRSSSNDSWETRRHPFRVTLHELYCICSCGPP